ncbi:MAG: hypothetical protein HGB08_00810 [Candidatus Moranbacteria bacterium]|nr:hypothetical protein [Candidatus Moranbacteria bacterium]
MLTPKRRALKAYGIQFKRIFALRGKVDYAEEPIASLIRKCLETGVTWEEMHLLEDKIMSECQQGISGSLATA